MMLLVLLLSTLSLDQQCDERSQGCRGSSQAGSDCKDKPIMVMRKVVMMILSLKDEAHDNRINIIGMMVVNVNTKKIVSDNYCNI